MSSGGSDPGAKATARDLAVILGEMEQHKRRCALCRYWTEGNPRVITCVSFMQLAHAAVTCWSRLAAASRNRQVTLFDHLLDIPAVEIDTEGQSR